MKNLYNYFIRKQSDFYKLILFISSTFLVVYIFPKSGQFKYEFQKGKIWQHQTLYAPFDFTVLKSEKELENEKNTILAKQVKYHRFDSSIYDSIIKKYNNQIKLVFPLIDSSDKLYLFGRELIDKIYRYGVLPVNFKTEKNIIIVSNSRCIAIRIKILLFNENMRYIELK